MMTENGFDDDDDAHQHGQWEDYTCATPWEDFVRALEDVLREWKACGTGGYKYSGNMSVLCPGILYVVRTFVRFMY